MPMPMKLRTELHPQPLLRQIAYGEKCMLLGSCFTEHIGQWWQQHWLDVCCNPWGVLFNPASIARSLQRCLQEGDYTPPLTQRDGHYCSFDHHGSIAAPSPEELMEQIRRIESEARDFFLQADHLLITWGTAWVFERQGEVVANCHKAPASEFVRRRLSVDEIVEMWRPLIGQRHWIFTVSPIRHLADGLHGNQLSKATLLLAIEQLQQLFPTQVEYLPVYELLMDDLRDYRFYAEDLVHPAPLAIEAVRELVGEMLLSPQLNCYLQEAAPLVRTLAHRPSDPDSPTHQALIRRTLQQRDALFQKYG